MNLQTAIRLALCGAATVSVAHAADNTTLEAVTIAADKSRVSSEETRDYTVPAMSSATGIALSAQETPQSTSVITQQQLRDQTFATLPAPCKAPPASPSAKLTAGATPSARAALPSTNTKSTA